ncbi:hypothetical protein M2323_003995 [Rhodoblastus acidophilus]|nr:hypothetical protein [Rhodoblastus acidophilus]MCW2335051.1 hypothetical protein [Rhodoblastus acidophilus]
MNDGRENNKGLALGVGAVLLFLAAVVTYLYCVWKMMDFLYALLHRW